MPSKSLKPKKMSDLPKFLLDENVRVEVKEFLENKGFTVKYVPKGSKNREVASVAKETKSVLITHDTDFANPFLYPPKEFSGIVILRIPPSSLDKILSSLEKLLSKIEDFSGKLISLEEEGSKVVG